LGKSSCNKTSLETRRSLVLDIPDPFGRDNICAVWTWNEIPGVIAEVRVPFFENGRNPLLFVSTIDSFLIVDRKN